MTNAERIERLHKCASFEICNPEMCDLWSRYDCRSVLLNDAADALEAAEKGITELEDEIKGLENAYIAELRQAHRNVESAAEIYREWYEAVGRYKNE